MFPLQKPEPPICLKYIYLKEWKMGSKMGSKCDVFAQDRCYLPRRRVLHLSEGHVSFIWVIFLRLGKGKLLLGEGLLSLGKPKTRLLLCPSSGKGCLHLGEPPRLNEAVPSSTTSAFSSFDHFFACFFLQYLQNINE